MNRKSEKILIGAAVAVLIFLHTFMLTGVPYGLNVDETGAGYDAFCLANFGVDRFLKSYPLYFTNFGDGQNAMYTYLAMICFKLFGASALTLRIPMVLSSFAAAFLGYRFVRNSQGSVKMATAWLWLYTIMPVFIMTQRFGLESHLMLTASIAVLWAGEKVCREGKWSSYVILGLVTGAALYTYALTYIVIPIFLVLFLIYLWCSKRFDLKKTLVLAVILFVLALPLMMIQVINLFDLPEMKIGMFTLTKLMKYRSNELSVRSLWSNLVAIFRNCLGYDDLRYNTIPAFGTFYYISIPFFCVGLAAGVKSLVQKKADPAMVLTLFWFGAEVIMGLLLTGGSEPNTTRMIGIFIPMLYFILTGLTLTLQKIRHVGVHKAVTGGLVAAYGVYFLIFAGYYFTGYNDDAFPMKWLFNETYEDVRVYLEENRYDWEERTFHYPWGAYIYYVWEYKISPYDLNLPVNGRERYGKDGIEGYPDRVDLQANYVVYKTDTSSMEYLDGLHYSVYPVGENFFLYVSPMDRFAESSEVKVQVDDIRLEQTADGGEVYDATLMGWCFEEASMTCVEELTLEIDGLFYPVERMERPDVAAAFGSQQLKDAGFKVTVPYETLMQAKQWSLQGMCGDRGVTVLSETAK